MPTTAIKRLTSTPELTPNEFRALTGWGCHNMSRATGIPIRTLKAYFSGEREPKPQIKRLCGEIALRLGYLD